MISSPVSMRPTAQSECNVNKKRKLSGSITEKICTDLPPRKIVRVVSGPQMTLIKKQNSRLLRSPQECLASILSSQGVKVKIYKYDSIPGFFEEAKKDEVKAYGFDVLKAVRESDIEQLRSFQEDGRPLKCSNRFGESILHLACRLGLVSVVDFLVNEAGVPLRVIDDMGRTPLHDAFWTPEPVPDLVDVILKACPDLLYVSDKRGHTPLSYARRKDWKRWTKYLKSMRPGMIVPTYLNR